MRKTHVGLGIVALAMVSILSSPANASPPDDAKFNSASPPALMVADDLKVEAVAETPDGLQVQAMVGNSATIKDAGLLQEQALKASNADATIIPAAETADANVASTSVEKGLVAGAACL